MTHPTLIDWILGAATAAWGTLALTAEDLTGPGAALVVMATVGIAIWRGAGVLFDFLRQHWQLDRAERQERHAENLHLHQHNADQMRVLIESQQLAQLETAKAIRENALSLTHMSETLRGRKCWAEPKDL